MSESSKKHKMEAPTQLDFAVIMCSTSRFNLFQKGRQIDDPSGDLIAETLEKAGHNIASRVLVPDNMQKIRKVVRKALKAENIQAIIVCGGTGITSKDVTVETVEPLLEKSLPGFGELFRKLSFDEIGSAAILSRAIAGVSHQKAIFCIPGSRNAVKLCLDKLILPETGHIVKHLREMP